jgi:NAD(P)-dependent dehydrogenase (short-subunit alcohol dehydrogenase family)
VAKALDSQQARLALCDINIEALEKLKDELQRDLDGHQICPLDVTSSSHCNRAVDSIVDHFGKVDFLFNCAGVNPTYFPLEKTTDDYWSRVVNTNLQGTYFMTRACLPVLRAGSAIVNVSSVAGLRADAGYAIYNAAKFGVIGFSKAMALELGPKGIRVNVVAPGFITTPTNNMVLRGDDAVRRAEEGVALRRMGTAEEVANVVTFLFSGQSSYVNGSVVEISGGL